MEKGGLEIMFRGVSLKLAYNAAYILNLRNLYDVLIIHIITLSINLRKTLSD
jgi:hypothetical protein